MKYKVIIRGETWILDIKNKVLRKRDNPKEVKFLNQEQVEWYRENLFNLFGRINN